MEALEAVLAAIGGSAAISGLLMWFFKRFIDKRDKQREEHDKNVEALILTSMKNSRATYVLAKATAVAVQRIPDAKCNGDMTKALKDADDIQKKELDLLFDQGVRRIVED